MTNLINFKDAIKKEFITFISIVIVIALMGYGIVSTATDDIKSATQNFSVMGTVSEMSENGMVLINAKGSDKSGNTTYDLNTEHLQEIETNTYVAITSKDIHSGDTVIAQGLTNGNTFFIKRIISFAAIAKTDTDNSLETATSTATTSTDITSTTTGDIVSTSSKTIDVKNDTVDNKQTSSSSATVDTTAIEISTATTTQDSTEPSEPVSTTTVSDIIEKTVDTVQEVVTGVVENVTDTINTIQESILNTTSSDKDVTQ